MNKEDMKILDNEIIQKIIKKLNLNQEQIQSGMHIFEVILMEQDVIDELDFITKVKIYDEANIVAITVPNGKHKEELLRKKYHKLSNITWIHPNIKFSHSKQVHEIDEHNEFFFWELETSNGKIQDRSQVLSWFKNFFKLDISASNPPHLKSKGFFISGGFGFGKTTFVHAFTNYLVEHQKSVVSINLSDLANYLKTKMNDQAIYNEVVEELKNVDYLIIDDIGSEKPSEWLLFSTLYPILDHRMTKNKFCGFTSNFNQKSLLNFYNQNKDLKGGLKIERLMDRIQKLSIQVFISETSKK